MDPTVLAKVVKDIDESVPEIVSSSTVAILCTQGQTVGQIGTGTLLAIADARLLITAGHVAALAGKMDGTPGLATINQGGIVALSGNWIISSSDGEKTHGDKYDLAIYSLTKYEQECLSGAKYVRLDDVDVSPDFSNGYYVMCGFPNVWSESSSSRSSQLKLKPLMYGVWSYVGSTAGLSGYDKETHILLVGKSEILLDHVGRQATMRTRAGHWVDMPGGLRGISGCSVWLVGDTRIPPKYWGYRRARIVAVETGVYEGATLAVKATRWAAALSLIYHAFPELRPVIDFHIENPE